MPKPPGRTTTRTRIHARVTFAALCQSLSNYARMAVPTRGDEHADPDFYIQVGRQVGLASQELKFVGVCHMRRRGHTWEDVARAVGIRDVDLTRGIYEDAYERWLRGDANPWRTREGQDGVAAMPTDAYSTDPWEMAGRLDEWCAENGAADGPLLPGMRAVTDGLR